MDTPEKKPFLTSESFVEAVLTEVSQNKQLRSLIEVLPFSIYKKSPQGVYEYINGGALQLTGISSPSEIIGLNDMQILQKKGLPTSYAETWMARDRQIMETGIPMRNEIEAIPLNEGGEVYMMSTKIPLKEGDKVVGLIGISLPTQDGQPRLINFV